MTNLAAIYDWISARAFGGEMAEREGRGDAEFRVRSLPKEDIHLFVKRIDNTKVIRVVDNRDWMASVSLSGGVPLASLLLILLLLPGGYNLLASRRMEKLRDERQQLTNELRIVRIREAKMRNAKQLKAWEHNQFVEPVATAVVFAPPPDTAVASAKVPGADQRR
jgi:hypothetical protein